MKQKKIYIKVAKKNLGILFFSTLLLLSCRKEQLIPDNEIIPAPTQNDSTIVGLYILNEGNMNSNMASLDFYDFSNGHYKKNIYNTANPNATLGLGDVGNDMTIYGSKMYIVVNASNKVEVVDANTTKRINTINIKNGRYVTAANGKVYVSAYNAPINIDLNSPNGAVYEIDTSSLAITKSITVGRQPEEIAIVQNKLYVANSGGYSAPNYESTITVVDVNSFNKIKDIDVAINLHRLKADQYGNLYVSSRGDYYNTPSSLFKIDTKTDIVKKNFEIAASNFTIAGDSIYIIGNAFNYTTGDFKTTYHILNIPSEKIIDNSFIKDGTDKDIQTPYGICIDPVSKILYITDATDYISSGKVYGYNQQGKRIVNFSAGNIPSAFSFLYQPKK